jgi:4-diphosphocytidyl-2-C-methyl-D-erythritol kinase
MRDSLTLEAPAKINLTLRVGARRADGFHGIRSVMQAVSLCDTITITRTKSDSDSLKITGPESPALDSPMEGNLALRALTALRTRNPDIPHCHLDLEKVIPVGGGLGGGSSDCAAVLRGANELFELGLSREELIEIGAELGSDVPFFFSSGSALVSGRGESFEPLNAPLDYSLVLINPGIHISTAEAFGELDKFRSQAEGEDCQNAENTPLTSSEIGFNFSGSGEVASWWRSLEEEGSDFESLYLSGRCKAKYINDFAEALLQIQGRLQQSHASLIRVSGSGSTVFGVFCADGASEIESERFDSIVRRGWRVFICRPISLPDISV